MSEGTAGRVTGGTDQFALPGLVAAAHELKSPLAIIRQLAQSIQDGSMDADDIQLLAERIGLTSDRALRLTSDLTKSSRLDDGLFELEPVDVLPLCQDVARELEPLYSAKGLRLRTQPRRRSLPLAIAHRDLLRRVLINFLDNALHYASSDQAVELFANYRRSQDVIRLGVRDFGPGVPAAFMRGLNRPQALAYRPQSSGLGLYLASQFAATMQAQLGVIQHRDGVSFYVDLRHSSQLRLW